MCALKLAYSYLINRTQTMKVEGEHSTKGQVKSTTRQGSLLHVLLCNIYSNDTFDSIEAELFNFADDNNLLSVGHTMHEAKATLSNEKEVALNWIEANEMIDLSKSIL